MNQYSNNINKQKIIQAYTVEKLSITKVAQKFGHAPRVVSKILTDKGITIRKCSAYSKYGYVENFFQVIDNEEKAYWLGFLYADGCVCGGQISLELGIKDLKHLEKFKSAIAPGAKITFCKKKRKFEYKDYCRIRLTSTEMVSQIKNLGCIPAKSQKLIFPSKEIVPDSLISHFIRGYFDGDGCLKYNRSTKTPSVTVVGTEQFLNYLQGTFESHIAGYTKTKLAPCGNVKTYVKGGRTAAKAVMDFLYKDAHVWLDRKFERYKQYWMPPQE